MNRFDASDRETASAPMANPRGRGGTAVRESWDYNCVRGPVTNCEWQQRQQKPRGVARRCQQPNGATTPSTTAGRGTPKGRNKPERPSAPRRNQRLPFNGEESAEVDVGAGKEVKDCNKANERCRCAKGASSSIAAVDSDVTATSHAWATPPAPARFFQASPREPHAGSSSSAAAAERSASSDSRSGFDNFGFPKLVDRQPFICLPPCHPDYHRSPSGHPHPRTIRPLDTDKRPRTKPRAPLPMSSLRRESKSCGNAVVSSDCSLPRHLADVCQKARGRGCGPGISSAPHHFGWKGRHSRAAPEGT
ncbi:unnamed protein product [Lampetra fluviatilis]